MDDKALLILVDGMRPDSLYSCGHPFFDEFLSASAVSMDAAAVVPPVTLPCHMSLFHSVDPGRHGILTNLYTPQVRPIPGLCEQLRRYGKSCGFFYTWEELRDLSRPDSLAYGLFVSGHQFTYPLADRRVAAGAAAAIRENSFDFVFLYLGLPDAIGHDKGWMGPEYLDAVRQSWDCIETAVRGLPDSYSVIVTADHGGHDRIHGEDCEEDMRIPILCRGHAFAPGTRLTDACIKDIAPTVAHLLGVPAAQEWEGRSLL